MLERIIVKFNASLRHFTLDAIVHMLRLTSFQCEKSGHLEHSADHGTDGFLDSLASDCSRDSGPGHGSVAYNGTYLIK